MAGGERHECLRGYKGHEVELLVLGETTKRDVTEQMIGYWDEGKGRRWEGKCTE